MTVAAVLGFQIADIYQVQMFRGQLRQITRMLSAWTVVFLLFIGASFFAKIGGEILAAVAIGTFMSSDWAC